jgi:hypothetical protein
VVFIEWTVSELLQYRYCLCTAARIHSAYENTTWKDMRVFFIGSGLSARLNGISKRYRVRRVQRRKRKKYDHSCARSYRQHYQTETKKTRLKNWKKRAVSGVLLFFAPFVLLVLLLWPQQLHLLIMIYYSSSSISILLALAGVDRWSLWLM